MPVLFLLSPVGSQNIRCRRWQWKGARLAILGPFDPESSFRLFHGLGDGDNGRRGVEVQIGAHEGQQLTPVRSKYSNMLKPWVMALPPPNSLGKTLRANSGPCSVVFTSV